MSGDSTRPGDGGRAFWVTTAIGWTIIAAAVVGAFTQRRDAKPTQLVRWVLGAVVLHDLVWLPVIAVVGLALRRAFRGRPPRVVTWGLATSAVLVVVAWPFVRGYGRQSGHPSLLPRDYGAGLAAYLGAVWALVLVVLATGALRRRVLARRARRSAEVSG